MRSEAQAVEVKLDLNKVFTVQLRGAQIKYLLEVLSKAALTGAQVFQHADAVTALQKPILDDAHGAVTTNGD